jgi:hypothetical protein
MGCESFKPMILLSLRGDLDAEGREMLSEHLSGCPSCRRDLAEFRAVFDLTGIEDGAACPDMAELLSHTVRSIRSEEVKAPPRRSGFRRLLGPVSTAAALVLLFSIGVVLVLQYLKPGEKEPSLADAPEITPVGLIALKELEFELPEITLRKMTLASHTENAKDVRWEDDFEAVRSFAAYSSSPILYEVYFEGCPIASWINREHLKNDDIVDACGNYLCIRRTSENHLLDVTPDVTPAFFIIRPDGEVIQQFGGIVPETVFLETLSSNKDGSSWMSYRTGREYRAILEKAMDAYRQRSFRGLQEQLERFAACCRENYSIQSSGIFGEFEQLKNSVQSYVDSKHDFARALAKNGEIDRAQNFYVELLGEFGDLPVAAVLREELGELLGSGR